MKFYTETIPNPLFEDRIEYNYLWSYKLQSLGFAICGSGISTKIQKGGFA